MRRKAGTVVPLSDSPSMRRPRRSATRSWPVGDLDDPLATGLGDPPSRPLFQRLAYPPRISLNALLLGLLCVVLLAALGFLPLSLPVPLHMGTLPPGAPPILMRYTLQVPIALFIAAFLGRFIGMTAIFLYVAIGLTLAPVFANGGGLAYVAQPGFGYWLGVLIASAFLGGDFYRCFQKEERGSCSLKIARQALTSVFIVHGIGMAYLIALTVAQQIPAADLPGWILRLSMEPLPYDILATILLLCLVRQTRFVFMPVLY